MGQTFFIVFEQHDLNLTGKAYCSLKVRLNKIIGIYMVFHEYIKVTLMGTRVVGGRVVRYISRSNT